MRHSVFSKSASTALMVSLMLAILVIPLKAQCGDDSRSAYDRTCEITVTGTVFSLMPPARGMILGPHLLLTTARGQVDVSLGKWGLVGKGALSVVPGQQVDVTGVMKTVKGKDVLVARTITVNGKVHTMRNEHGIPVSPQARERVAERGESL